MTTLPPAPQAIIHLVKCKCTKERCSTNRCQCKKNGLNCTDLYGCSDSGEQCENVLNNDSDDEINIEEDDHDDDNDDYDVDDIQADHIAESPNYLLLQEEKEVLVLTLWEIPTFNRDKTYVKTFRLQLSRLASESLVLMLLKFVSLVKQQKWSSLNIN